MSPKLARRDGLNRLRHRFGFLAQRAGATPPALEKRLARSRWDRQTIDGFTLWTHPDSLKRSFRRGDVTLVILGDVYHETGGRIDDWFLGFDPADERALHQALDALAGRFALLAFGGGRMRAYHDPLGSRSVYYHAQAPAAVSSHSALLASASGAERCPEMAAYIARPEYRRLPAKSLPGDRTLYRGVLALIPNNLFDSASGGLRRFWPREPLARSDREAFLARADQSLAALAAYVRGRYHPVFGLTGGADTRAAIAAFRSEDLPFETVTWGKTRLFPGEAEIVDDLAAYLGAPHAYLPKAAPSKRMDELARENSGGLYPSSRTLDFLRERFAGRADHVFIRGWGAEVMRGFYNLHQAPMKDLSAEEMARAYASPGWTAARRPETEGYFAAFRERAGYDRLGDVGIDPNDLFYWEHRVGMWCSNAVNVFDLVMPTLIAFNDRRLFAAAWGLPPGERLSKNLFLDLVARRDPKLAAFPLAVKPAAKPAEPARGAAPVRRTALATGARAVRRTLGRLARAVGFGRGGARREK